jgi:hypothetical protein
MVFASQIGGSMRMGQLGAARVRSLGNAEAKLLGPTRSSSADDISTLFRAAFILQGSAALLSVLTERPNANGQQPAHAGRAVEWSKSSFAWPVGGSRSARS